MAWTSRSHPQTRWQVRYRDGTTQRSVGTYPAKAEALSVRRAVEHRDHVAYSDQLPPGHASMLFGEYVTTIWWSAWKPAHPRSAEGTSSKLTARSCPASATCPGPAGRARRCRLAARPGPRGTLPRSIATYLSLLGTICNAAVDTGYLDHSSSPSPAADDDPRPSPPRRQSHPCRAWSVSPARRCSASPPPPPLGLHQPRRRPQPRRPADISELRAHLAAHPRLCRPGAGRAPPSSGCASTTCLTPTRSGCWPGRFLSAPSPDGWATPTPWSPYVRTCTPPPGSTGPAHPRQLGLTTRWPRRKPG